MPSDDAAITIDTFVGTARVPIADYLQNQPNTVKFTTAHIRRQSGTPQGKLHIGVSMADSNRWRKSTRQTRSEDGLSYCSFPSLKILLKNYLGIEENDVAVEVLSELEETVMNAEITPADVSEELIKKRRDRNKLVEDLLAALKIRAAQRKIVKLAEKIAEEAEAEEQEKRALDSPSMAECDELQDDCNKKEKLI